MTTFSGHSAAQLKRAQINGAYKAHGMKPPLVPGKTVDYSAPIKAFLAHGPKKTPEIAAMLGLSDATAYRRLSALADIKVITRGSHRGIKSIVWSLPNSDPASVTSKPRPYVAPFNRAGRSEQEFYGHRDMAMAARKI